MFAQCLDRKEQSAGDVALGVFLLGTDIDDGQLVAKRVHQLQGFSRGERAGLREFGGGGVAVCSLKYSGDRFCQAVFDGKR